MKLLLAVAGLCLVSVHAQTWRDDSLAVDAIRAGHPQASYDQVQYKREDPDGRITELTLTGSEYTFLPPEVLALGKLRTLALINCGIKDLPESLASLPMLEKLFLLLTPFSSLPEWLGAMPRLREVDVSQNELSSLPASLAANDSVRLNVEWNRLCDLPAATASLLDRPGRAPGWRGMQDCPLFESDSLDALAWFALVGDTSSPFRSVDSRLDIAAMRRAIHGLSLYPHASKPFLLPTHLGLVRRIESLSLNGYGVKFVSWDFKALSSLTHLSLSYNGMDALPDSLFEMPALRSLEIFGNPLKTLPPGIGASKLTSLILVYNHLESLPPEITALEFTSPCPAYKEGKHGPISYRCLQIHENRLCELPDAIDAWVDRHADNNWKERQDCRHVATRPGVLKANNMDVTLSPTGLSVTWSGSGRAEVFLHALDGTLVKRGVAAPRLVWGALRSGVYLVSTRVGGTRTTRRFVIP